MRVFLSVDDFYHYSYYLILELLLYNSCMDLYLNVDFLLHLIKYNNYYMNPLFPL